MKKRIKFFSTRELDDGDRKNEEIFVEDFCDIDFWKHRRNPNLLTREILESHLDEIIEYLEHHKNRQLNEVGGFNDNEGIELSYAICYQILAILILETGSNLPDKVKEEVLKSTTWDFDKRRCYAPDYEEPRKNYLEYLRKVISYYIPGKKVIFGDSPILRTPRAEEPPMVNGLDEFFDNMVRPHQITHLNLNDCQLTSIPDEVFLLTNLKELHLGGNSLNKVSSDIKNLTHLEVLDLSNNNLIKLPNEIGDLKALRELWIHKNQIKNLPKSIERIFSLRILGVIGNPIDYEMLYSIFPNVDIF